MSKTSYHVTDVAGERPDIAGKRRKIGEKITLTAAEAEFELLRGTIETVEAYEKRGKSGQVAEAQPSPPPAKGK